jgi:hypothetical protein
MNANMNISQVCNIYSTNNSNIYKRKINIQIHTGRQETTVLLVHHQLLDQVQFFPNRIMFVVLLDLVIYLNDLEIYDLL